MPCKRFVFPRRNNSLWGKAYTLSNLPEQKYPLRKAHMPNLSNIRPNYMICLMGDIRRLMPYNPYRKSNSLPVALSQRWRLYSLLDIHDICHLLLWLSMNQSGIIDMSNFLPQKIPFYKRYTYRHFSRIPHRKHRNDPFLRLMCQILLHILCMSLYLPKNMNRSRRADTF